MSVIESIVPKVEVYSIDEAFADLAGIPGDHSRHWWLGRALPSLNFMQQRREAEVERRPGRSITAGHRILFVGA
jgi:nucleotidyltransferase/DNA polymerase involved in DNA repair